MITTVLANAYGLVRLLLVLGAVLSYAIGWWLSRRGETGRRRLGGLAVVGVGAALALTLTPDDAGRGSQFCTVQARLLTEGALDLPNTMLLLPAALFGTLWASRPAHVLAAAAGLSVLIELAQGALPLGRSCDTDDLIANAMGAALGVLLAQLILALQRRRSRESWEQPR